MSTHFLNLTSGCTGKGARGAVGEGEGIGARAPPPPP